MTGSHTMTGSLNDLEATYSDVAAELRSAHAKLQNHAAELHRFVTLRDELKAHPEFPGALPETFFSGSDLDPDGIDGKRGLAWGETGRRS